ncbi:hypothetical protein DYH10_01165 [Candidatus Saccharibacteria bacterium CPR2]|nr:hypothetical protein [Candidatus Saccharibacteria bacterium CPR2]
MTIQPFVLFAQQCADKSIFGIPTWYKYLNCTNGVPDIDATTQEGLNSVWLIGAAVLEMLMVVVGIASVAMIIYAGLKFIMSQGNPEHVKQARDTIWNAIIGLGIALIASNSVSYAANQLYGKPADQSTITAVILPFVFRLAGALAVLYIVIFGALRYIMSGGNPNDTKQARDAIIYGLIGIAVIVTAYLIVQFVVGRLTS